MDGEYVCPYCGGIVRLQTVTANCAQCGKHFEYLMIIPRMYGRAKDLYASDGHETVLLERTYAGTSTRRGGEHRDATERARQRQTDTV